MERHRAKGIGPRLAIARPISIQEGLIPLAAEAVGDHRGAELLVEAIEALIGAFGKAQRGEVGKADDVLGAAGRAHEHQAGGIGALRAGRAVIQRGLEDTAIGRIGHASSLEVGRGAGAVLDKELAIGQRCGVEGADGVGATLALLRHRALVRDL